MPDKSMTASEAGRRGIAARIEKNGREAFLKSCSKSGRKRMKRLTPERRSEIAWLAAAARVFYAQYSPKKEAKRMWAEMSREKQIQWAQENLNGKH